MINLKTKITWFSIGFVTFWALDFISYSVNLYCEIKQENITQKQTIERLNNQLSKMDTLHDECFKVSEIRKNK
jgi:hypothetical protein